MPQGCVGAGAGATVGPMKGGIGTASTVLDSGITVGALVVANASGSAVDPETGVLYGELFQGRVDYPEVGCRRPRVGASPRVAAKNPPPR